VPAFAKYCSKCGEKNEDDNKFCISCGYKFIAKKSNVKKYETRLKKPTLKKKPIKKSEKSSSKLKSPPDIRTSKNPRKRYEWGLYFLDKKEFSTAKDEFKEAIRLRPDYAVAYNKLAFSYMKLNIYDEAISTYKIAIEHNKKDADAYYNLATMLRLDGDIYKERSYYEKTLKYNSKHRLALNNLAVNYISNQGEKKASRYLKRAIKLYPNYWLARSNMALMFLFKKETKKARETIIRAHDLNPDFYLIYYNMGVIYEKEGKYEEAIQMYRNCLKIKKNHLESRINLAALLRKYKKLQEAKELLLNVVEENSECAEAWLDLSLVYIDLDMEDDAVDARNQANAIDLNYNSHSYDQGITYGPKEFYDDGTYKPIKNKNPKYKMSLFVKSNDDLKEVENISANVSSRVIKGIETAEERFALGSKMLREGQIERAISDFKHAIKLNNGEYAEAFELIGVAYGSKGDYKKSVKFLEIAYKQDDHSESILVNLGKAYGVLRKYKEQIKMLNELSKINPDNTDVFYHMGMAYVKSKNYKKLLSNFRKFLNKEPNSIKKTLVEKMIRKYKNR
jgi:tetratricopeptide (TPR) repeat protein